MKTWRCKSRIRLSQPCEYACEVCADFEPRGCLDFALSEEWEEVDRRAAPDAELVRELAEWVDWAWQYVQVLNGPEFRWQQGQELIAKLKSWLTAAQEKQEPGGAGETQEAGHG